jgi:hypothetical protein
LNFIRVVLEVIRDGNEIIAAVLLEQAGDPFAAVAAADEADVNLRVGLRAAHQLRFQDSERQDRSSGSGNKPPAGDGGRVSFSVLILRCSHFKSSRLRAIVRT